MKSQNEQLQLLWDKFTGFIPMITFAIVSFILLPIAMYLSYRLIGRLWPNNSVYIKWIYLFCVFIYGAVICLSIYFWIRHTPKFLQFLDDALVYVVLIAFFGLFVALLFIVSHQDDIAFAQNSDIVPATITEKELHPPIKTTDSPTHFVRYKYIPYQNHEEISSYDVVPSTYYNSVNIGDEINIRFRLTEPYVSFIDTEFSSISTSMILGLGCLLWPLGMLFVLLVGKRFIFTPEVTNYDDETIQIEV